MIRIVKAPTGSGKTEEILNTAKEKRVLIAVPTLKLAEEIQKRALDKGLKTEIILGRNNYICGYKAKQENIEIDKDNLRCSDKKLRQDYVCCNRRACEFDAYSYQIEKINLTKPNLIITTHALLRNLCLTGRPPFEIDLIAIDEIHSFISSLKNPVPSHRVRVSDVMLLLDEMLKESFSSQTKSLIRLLKKKIERRLSGKPVFKLIKIIDTNNFEKVFDEYYIKEFTDIVNTLDIGLRQIRDTLPKKTKSAEKITLTTLLTETIGSIERVKKASLSGQYTYLKKTSHDIELGIMQILFSNAFYFVLNTFLKNTEGIEMLWTSATISSNMMKKLLKNREYVFENRDFAFENSHVNLFVYDKQYDVENRERGLDVAISLTEKLVKIKPVIILTTSYNDIAYLSEKLKHYKLLTQNKENNEDIVDKFNTDDYSILIGNRALWEGINIKKDCYFIFTKIPYFSPDEPEYQALEEFSKNSFLINKQSATLTLTQGLGRVIRDRGQTKTVFVLDARFQDFASIIKELPYSVDVSFFSDKHISSQAFEDIIVEPIPRDFICTYSNSLVDIVKERKIVKANISKAKENCRDLAESFEKRYSKVCYRVVNSYLNMFKFFKSEVDYDYIISNTGLSYVYIKKFEKGEKDEV